MRNCIFVLSVFAKTSALLAEVFSLISSYLVAQYGEITCSNLMYAIIQVLLMRCEIWYERGLTTLTPGKVTVPEICNSFLGSFRQPKALTMGAFPM